jgi:uncharacterized protein (TIGR00156 family)
MNRRTVSILTVLTFTASTAGLVHAQYAGPSDTKPPQTVRYASVAEILKKPVDDVRITLQGTLTRKVGHEKYLFSDGTGEIRVEIDDKLFPGTKVDEKTRVTIDGEVEKDLLQSPEIDVKKIAAAT